MRYGVLGPVEARADDVAIAIGGPQQRRLLALLLSRPGQSISGERLVDCLWPDGLAPDGAGRSVMTYVSRLRAALGDSSIATVQEGYRLELAGSLLDSQQFETLLSEAATAEPGRAVDIYDRALALWRGSAYGDFGAEWWLLAEANRLNEMRVVAREERAEALLVLGNHHRLIPELERLAADHPLRERPVSLLMQGLFATGRNADALRAFQSFRARLGEETGLEPSSELVTLERSLASGEPIPNRNPRARLLRGYVVHEVLGEGAFGRVFAATQPGTNREVAIKAIRPDLSNSAEFIQRFEAEAQLVARLEHPHIVPLHDYWREPGGAYLVFRLLLGGSAFAAMVKDGPFSVARVSRLVEEVGSALLAAHTAGVVHCDIKPSNVLFDESGNAYLSDFGIAVTSSTWDQGGERTRVYAAPELADRTGDTIRSDIYSFGCMLWELLAGASPLSMMHSTHTRLPSLAGVVVEPCQALDAVLAKATSGDAEARFESMADLIVAWREAVGRPEGVLTPVGPRSDSLPDSSRRRAVQALSTAISSAVNPYKGLRSFAEADASDFFGRDDVASALRDTLLARSFVAVVGPSGSGKSSLVHAGLVPLLRRDGARVATMIPGDQPSLALREALRQIAATDSDMIDPSEWLSAAVWEDAGQIVLVIDQFEESWTLAEGGERERFLSTVLVAARSGVRCVTTVRADFYDRPLRHPLIGQMVADGTFALPPLSPQALEEVVVRPAERNGVGFDDGVVSAIVAEANAQPAGLPLLQFAMAELYERRVGNRVTAKALEALGGLGGAIGRRAESIYTSLDDDMQAHARQLFGRLVAPGSGTSDTRRRARFGELSEADRIVADRFVHARLLVADRDLATREPVIEVAHESLLTNWPRLREWLEADRRWLGQLQHLATATRTWEEAGRTDGELYRGSRLEAVIETLPEHEHHLNSDEHAFVAASRTARDAVLEGERRNAQRLRRLLMTTACVLALAVLAGAIAFTQRQQARTSATKARAAQRDAEITAVVARASSIRGTQLDTAALLAIEAYRQADTPRTRSALLSTFTVDAGYLGTERLRGSVVGPPVAGGVATTGGIVLPDGQTALVMGPDQRFRSYDLESGAVGEPWAALTDFSPGDSRFASSTDGRFVAQIHWDAATIDSTVLGVFDTSTHEPVAGPINIPFRVGSAVFRPDDTGVYVSGGYDGTVVEYTLADGREVGRLPGLEPPADSFLVDNTAGLAFICVAGTQGTCTNETGLLAVGSVQGTVRLVDPLTLVVVAEFGEPRGTTERFFAVDHGRALIGAGLFGQVRIDVLGSSTPVWEAGISDRLDVRRSDNCTAFAVAEQLGRYYCGDSTGRLVESDLTTGVFIRQLNAQKGSVGSIWLASDQTELVSFSGNRPLVARWRVDGSGPITRRMGEGYSPTSYSLDGTLLLADSGRGVAGVSSDWVVVDPHTGALVVHTRSAQFPAWRADGTLNGFTGIGGPIQFASFDPRTERFGMINPSLRVMPSDRFSSGHRSWLYYPTGEIWTIDNDTDTRIEPTLHVNGFVNGSGTDTGDRVAIATLAGIVIFDGRTGETLHTISEASPRGAYIVGGKLLVAVGQGGDMNVYDLETFEMVATLGGEHGFGRVLGSGDGSLAVAPGADRSTILYDLTTGEQIGDPIIIPDNEVVASALRPDGQELAVGGGSTSQFTVWDLDPQHWITAACKIAGRNLTPQEWKTNIGDLALYHRTCPAYD